MSHHLAGQRVYLVSASPEEIVLPMAELLGADGESCSWAEVDDDGRYTGRMAFFADGPHKAEAITELAETLGLDLAALRPPTATRRPTSRCWSWSAGRWRSTPIAP